jgi:uncharacterized protein (DUF2267 family)
MNFEKYAATGHAFVNDVVNELNTPDTAAAERILICVLHALRARLTLQQSFHLLAQLPMAIKAVYVEGWRPSTTPDREIRSVEDFIGEMLAADRRNAARDFPDPRRAELAATAVFRVLKRHVAAGEVAKVGGELPSALRRFWSDA